MHVSMQPMGDQALLASFQDEDAAACFAAAVRHAPPAGFVDVVQAYSTVAVYFTLDVTCYREVAAHSQTLADSNDMALVVESSILHRIPCCYEFPLDQERVAQHTGLSVDEVIRLHTEAEYRVYAIGFCPGFPYLGYLPERLRGVPRLDTPRVRVEAGTVGLTGKQTGIYTEVRPGGWNLIGKTPLTLVSMADGYFPLRTGDRVQFERIDEPEYRRLLGERLPERQEKKAWPQSAQRTLREDKSE
ncbi:5-oxoprolinase subunit PxpB [soil metagenome]